MHSGLLSVDDIDERRLQAGTTNQEAIDIWLLGQFTAVLLSNATTVQNSGLLGRFGRDFLLQPLTDRGMDFLCLLSGSDLAGADSPSLSVSGESDGGRSQLTRWVRRRQQPSTSP